ncbi:hypothetical protein GCM10010435_48160 [Winogradskya consettensis]|uniref:Uncharacterized protein n=1 Tax=Winogradskya consettensis TaxID=113560 RepID=A0A919SK69_9ACTN|nr:hypothetical protein [Actinoplanes consettensis]GIM72992.1 hypothetical protein Aco04nite_33090 [Actinoplanes consettensis]
MNDLDTFRTALHGDEDGRPPALDDIMSAGRKLRLKRRAAIATVAAAALVVTGGVTATTWQAQAPPAQTGAPAASAWPTPSASAAPDGYWGLPVDTGIRQRNSKIKINAFHNDNPAYPDIEFGIRVCAATPTDAQAFCDNTFDEEAPDNSPGFHAIGLPSSSENVNLPMYGYYVGPATTITVKSRGKVRTAKTATWSEDPNVVFFWFPLDQVYLQADKNDPMYKLGKVTKNELPDTSDWTAYDAAGAELPVGKPFVIG